MHPQGRFVCYPTKHDEDQYNLEKSKFVRKVPVINGSGFLRKPVIVVDKKMMKEDGRSVLTDEEVDELLKGVQIQSSVNFSTNFFSANGLNFVFPSDGQINYAEFVRQILSQ